MFAGSIQPARSRLEPRSIVATDDVEQDDLDTKVMRSSAWAVLGYGGTHALSFVTMLVLARLLVPEDFGLVALAFSLLAVALIAQESGLGAALIVYRGDLRRAAAAVSIFSPLVACGLYVLCFAVAPVAADIFNEPRLTSVLRVMAFVVVLRGLAIMPLSLLEREMKFGPMTAIEVGAGVGQAATAIALGVAGAGVWSLVAGQLAFGLATMLLAWFFTPLRPSPFEARRETLRELMRYGRHVGVANLINYGNANAPTVVVGRVLGATALGYFSLASRLAAMPVSVLGNILGRGVFAAMSRVQDDSVRFRQIWLQNVQRLALLSTPTAIGLALVAEPLVIALLGEKWRPAIVPLQILALNGILRTFSATSGEVFQALHRPQLRVYAEGTYLALIVPGLVVGAHWGGIAGAALGVVLVNVAFGIGLLAVIMRLLHVSPAELTHAILKPVAGWALLAVTLLVLRPVVDELSSALALIALVGVGAVVYGVVVTLFARDILVTMWLSLRGVRTSS
jgi:O-antigen/teichoic acid export membrane protein